jgi:hypothetical protein
MLLSQIGEGGAILARGCFRVWCHSGAIQTICRVRTGVGSPLDIHDGWELDRVSHTADDR